MTRPVTNERMLPVEEPWPPIVSDEEWDRIMNHRDDTWINMVRFAKLEALLLTLLAWAGTTLQVVGVLMLSSNLFNMQLVFSTMLVGSLVWFTVAVKRADWSLAALNAVFVISNIVGIIRWA